MTGHEELLAQYRRANANLSTTFRAIAAVLVRYDDDNNVTADTALENIRALIEEES